MSRDVDPGPSRPDRRPPDPGHIGATGRGPLLGFALTGLVLGWALRPLAIRLGGSPPTVGLLPVLALFLVAAIMACVAWLTWRTLQRRREWLAPHLAVNRLVLAKSCALAGAMVAGGYLGYALSFWGLVDSSLERERVQHSLLAALACVLIVTASLLLERACRIRPADDADLP